jgi:hypothetical protein
MPHAYRLFSFIIILLFSGSLTGCAGGAVHSKPGTATTVILIRHAERTDITKVLTDKGHERAQALVEAVGDMNITAIYSPNLERNLDTVRPLADHLGIAITIKPKISMPRVNEIVNEMLTLHSGETVLWVGNVSGNLGSIYWRLGGKGDGPFNYGEMFILTVPDQGPTRVVKTRYGL